MNQINKTNNVRTEDSWTHVSLCTEMFSCWEEKLSPIHFSFLGRKLNLVFLGRYTGIKLFVNNWFKYYLEFHRITPIPFREENHYLPIGVNCEHTPTEQKHSQVPKKVKVKVARSCLTLYDTIDYTVHGILQARILEWVAVPFSRASSEPRYRTQVSLIAGEFFTSWAIR